MVDQAAAILETLRAVPAGEVLRVTYQSEGASKAKNYYGFIEGVGVSKTQDCVYFTLKTPEGTKTFLQRAPEAHAARRLARRAVRSRCGECESTIASFGVYANTTPADLDNRGTGQQSG